jgi:hypothetical protein
MDYVFRRQVHHLNCYKVTVALRRDNERLRSAYLYLPQSRSPSATSSNLSLTAFTRSTCASTSPRFLILIAARAARENSYDRETDSSIASLVAVAVVGRGGPVCADEARTAARSTLDARRIARSRRVSSRASGGASFLLAFAVFSVADAAAAAAAFGLDSDDMDGFDRRRVRAVRYSFIGPCGLRARASSSMSSSVLRHSMPLHMGLSSSCTNSGSIVARPKGEGSRIRGLLYCMVTL